MRYCPLQLRVKKRRCCYARQAHPTSDCPDGRALSSPEAAFCAHQTDGSGPAACALLGRGLDALLPIRQRLACLLLGTAGVRAALTGTMRITLLDEEDTPVPNINVTLCQVAVTAAGGTTLTPQFEQLPLSVDQLCNDSGAQHAETVYQYVHAKELDGSVQTTNSKGVVYFEGLEQGIYLVFEEGGQGVSFQPYLVTLPVQINGQLIYHVSSQPKTSRTETGTFWVSKLWEDHTNAAGKRPGSVQVTLLHDGKAERKVTLSAENDWQYRFHQLDAQGTYTVKEQAVSRYRSAYYPVIEGCVIVNTYTGGGGGTIPSTGHVCVYKVWDDAGTRPDRITVQLVSDGTVVKTATLSAANSWSYTFTGLDKSKTYTVQEVPVAGYAASYSGNAASGITITNRHTPQPDQPNDPEKPDPPTPVVPDPEQIDIPLQVVWDDEKDRAGARPEAVTVHLIANGSIISTLQAGSDGAWTGVFAGVPADLAYSVWQLSVEGYSTAYYGSAAEGFTVANTYRKETQPDPPSPPTPPTPPEEVEPPVTPVRPTIPQTGMELWPLWLLLAAGGLLVVLGWVDICRGRKEP